MNKGHNALRLCPLNRKHPIAFFLFRLIHPISLEAVTLSTFLHISLHTTYGGLY